MSLVPTSVDWHLGLRSPGWFFGSLLGSLASAASYWSSWRMHFRGLAAHQLYNNVDNWVTCISSSSRQAPVCSQSSQDSRISQSMKLLRTMLQTGALSQWPHSTGPTNYKTKTNSRDGNINSVEGDAISQPWHVS